jgi:LacI family transcriptional regulator
VTSIRTIAKLAGTSVSSVSRVLNRSGYVSDAVRAKVEAAVAALDYTPSQGARVLRGAQSRIVGVLLPALDVPFFGMLAQAIERELFARNYQAVICSSAENAGHEARYVSTLLAQRVDGVIVASARGGPDTAFARLEAAGVPLVAVDRDLPGLAQAVVSADHRAGGILMARHLIDLGHRAIAIIGAPAHSLPVQLRLEGVLAELVAEGIVPRLIRTGEDHSFAATQDLARAALAEAPEITALIGLSDIAAIGALHAAREAGRSVPEDLSVIGFDDTPEAAYMQPGLTTVRQPVGDVGRLAATRMLALIAGEPCPPRDDLPVTLIVRGSTGPARPPSGSA